jgi:hypothetical protein
MVLPATDVRDGIERFPTDSRIGGRYNELGETTNGGLYGERLGQETRMRVTDGEASSAMRPFVVSSDSLYLFRCSCVELRWNFVSSRSGRFSFEKPFGASKPESFVPA